MSLSAIGSEVTFGEAIDLIDGLTLEPGTRTHASVRRWLFPMSNAEWLAQVHLLAYMNVHRNEKKHPVPFSLPWPHPDAETVTPEERAVAATQLEARSAMRDR